jgi:hypothetical protein
MSLGVEKFGAAVGRRRKEHSWSCKEHDILLLSFALGKDLT